METRLVKIATPSPLVRYGIAIAAALGGLLIRFPVASMLGNKLPYITFFLATSVSAYYGGFGPGIVTTLLGVALADYFFVPSLGLLSLGSAADILGALLFVGISGFISFLAGRLLETRRHEQALRQIFHQTLVSIGDAVISTDVDKNVRFMNRIAEQLTGWKESEAKGLPIEKVFRIVREDSDVPAELPIEKVLSTGSIAGLANHTELIARDGRRIPIDDSAAPIRDTRGETAGVVLVFRDISERRAVDRALEASESRCRNILESITEAFLLLDKDWRIADTNPAAEKVLRAPAQDLLGKIFWDLFPATLGSNLESSFRHAVQERKPAFLEYHYEPWDEWFDISAYPSQQGLAVYLRDISARKQDEAALVRLNQDLKQFTFAATHDIREPLRMIMLYTQLLQNKLELENSPLTANIVEGAQRISRLLDGLLQFSRLGEYDAAAPSVVDTEAALRDTLEDLQVSIHERNAAVTHDPLPLVLADHAHICQLFQNLIANSLKYCKPGTKPAIHVTAAHTQGICRFAIHDNGIGISSEFHHRIFEPFKRLHGPEISGSGIGLATCKRIIERYGGKIWVESAEGQGATFYFTLAEAKQAAAAHATVQ